MQKPKRIYWPLSYILLFRYLSWMLDLELLKGRNLYFLILIFSGPSAEPGTEWTFSTCPFNLDLLPVCEVEVTSIFPDFTDEHCEFWRG